jgi:2-polyprenyl-3-methyl-5-hydroxy-6-metoxy-1,4-benzoquinol methylase
MTAQRPVTGDDNRLTRQENWKEIWGDSDVMLTFDPRLPFFSDIHRMLKRHLPYDPSLRALEVGCYPGTYMAYFHHHFGYWAGGIEYVESCVQKCRKNMESLGIAADVRHADLFEMKPGEQWDVVFSVGFIEHFTNIDDVVKRHLDLVTPGGYLVLIIPNHSGLNGRILRWIDKDKYDLHNHMDYKDMKTAVEAARTASIIEGGYYGRLGFWNIDLYPWLQKKGKAVYFLGRVVFYSLERIAKFIVPETKFLSPNCALVARKEK